MHRAIPPAEQGIRRHGRAFRPGFSRRGRSREDWRPGPLLTLLTWVLALGLVSCQGPLGREGRAASRIAVVDLGRVFELSHERREREAELNEIVGADRARFQAAALEVAEMRRDVDALPEGDPDRTELELRLNEEIEAQRSAMAQAQRRVSERVRNATLSFKERVRDVIQELGAAGDYDLILERSIEMEGMKQAGVPPYVWEIVHFSRAELDLTDEVARRLNLAHVERDRPSAAGRAREANPGGDPTRAVGRPGPGSESAPSALDAAGSGLDAGAPEEAPGSGDSAGP